MRTRSRARFILMGSAVAIVSAGLSANSSGTSATAIASSAAGRASDNAAIAHAKLLENELSPIVSPASTTTPTFAITAALSMRPQGVRVDQITYTAGSPASLMLVGSADTTSGISAYRTALSADPIFASVSVPVGALVGTEGGRFSITLSGKF